MVEMLATAKGAIELTKRGLELAEKLKSVELKEIILALKEEALERREEILSLKERVSDMEKAADLDSKLEFDNNNLLWVIEGGEKQGPYCGQCKDSNGQMVRLYRQPREGRGVFHECPACKAQPDIHVLAPFAPMRISNSGRGEDW